MASKTKTDMMRAMMRHQGTSKLLREAVKSPLGSTSRSQAAKVFTIMSKLQAARDGSGGPGMMMMQDIETDPNVAGHVPTDNSQGMVIFHKLPPIKINYDGTSTASKFKPHSVSFDGSGGPGYVYDGEGGIGDWFSNALNEFKGALGNFGNTIGTGLNEAGKAVEGLFTPSTTQAQTIPNAPANPAPQPTPVAPAPQPQSAPSSNTYVPGLISTNTLKNIRDAVAPVTGQAIDTIAFAPAAVGEFVSDNLGAAAQNLGRTLFGYQQGSQPAPYKAFDETRAMQTLAKAYPGVKQGVSQTASGQPSQPSATGQNAPFIGPQLPQGSTYPVVTGQEGDASSSGSSLVDTLKKSILSVESGGNYQAVNQHSGALGAYQIMPQNLSLVGLSSSVADQQKFLASPALQDLAFQKMIENLSTQYNGDVRKVVAAYYGGDNGAKVVDTPAGDMAQKNGYPSINQYVASVLGGGTGKTYADIVGSPDNTGLAGVGSNNAGVDAAVVSNLGPQGYAWKTMTSSGDPITGGKTLGQALATNQKTLWDKYNIPGLQQEEIKLKTAQASLPTDMQNYIRGRDEYLNQTDQMINDYIDGQTKKDMSNPADQQTASSYLNYLYTLRGAQNKRYIDYMNSAITQNQIDLQRVSDEYSTALGNYQTELSTANTITTDMYNTYYQALQDMYNAVDQAPTKAAQLEYLQAQIYGAYATSASDASKAASQSSYLKDASALNGHITDGQGYLLPGLNLTNTINQYATLEPGMSPTSIIAKYTEGVNNILNAREGGKTVEGQTIDAALKMKTAQEAIKQFTEFANTGLANNNLNTYQLGVSSAQEVAKTIGNIQGGALNSNPQLAQKIVEAIKSLNPTGSLLNWFPRTPSKDEFVKKLTSAGVDASIASAIYDEYQRYVSDGGTADGYVKSKLYNMTSTTDRANPQPLSTDQIMQGVGSSYANSLLTNALGNQSGAGVSTTLGM